MTLTPRLKKNHTKNKNQKQITKQKAIWSKKSDHATAESKTQLRGHKEDILQTHYYYEEWLTMPAKYGNLFSLSDSRPHAW